MGRGRHYDSYSSSDDDVYIERSRKTKDRVIREKSRSRAPRRRDSTENIIINNKLNVPGGFPQEGRQRSRSTSGQPQPIIIQERDRSRSRSRSRDREVRRLQRELDRLRTQEEWERKRDREERIEEEGSRKLKEARERWEADKDKAEREAKKKQDEYRRLLEEKEREEDRARDEYKRELDDQKRKDDEKRAKYLKEAADKAKADADEKKRIAEELKLAEAKREMEREEEEKRILREHEEKEKAKAAKEKELRERILAEEEERKRKEEEKKKKEEADFEEKIRLRAIEAGWSKSYADEILLTIKGKQRGRSRSPGGNSTSLVLIDHEKKIEHDRPTWIRIHCKHILPETLNAYRLRWDYDPEDEDYIIIKEYVDHDLQRELFAHTKKIIKSRKTITDGYTKETITTTLKPNTHVVKGKDQMFLVRRKSKSPAPDRRRLSFIV